MRPLAERHEIIGKIDGRIVFALSLDQTLAGLAEIIFYADEQRTISNEATTTKKREPILLKGSSSRI